MSAPRHTAPSAPAGAGLAPPRRDESIRWLPHPAVRPYVATYSGYHQEGVPAADHRGLPSPHLTVILTLEDPLVIARHPDARQAPGRYDALVGGLHTSPAIITHHGRQSGIQLAVRPLGCRALFGVPAGALAGLDVTADALWGNAVSQVRERLLAVGSWPARFAALDAALAAMVRDRRLSPLPPALTHAWSSLEASGGGVAVEALAHEVGWSSRQLRKVMKEETGLSPKQAARVFRFDRTRRHLAASVGRHAPLRLADLAAACGYYDQAHLDREFVALTGVPPGTWVREEFRNIQAGAHAAVSDSEL